MSKKIITDKVHKIKSLLTKNNISSLCIAIKCPNMGECFTKPTVTFSLQGDVCSRSCLFCNITSGEQKKDYFDEPKRLAQLIKNMGLIHIILNCACKDELADGGAYHIALCIHEIKCLDISASIEVLIPDFQGNTKALRTIVKMKPSIINHSVKTIPRLFPKLRNKTNYKNSLKILRATKRIDSNILSKSGLMLGLGETMDEVKITIKELRDAKCDILSIDQYIQTCPNTMPVKEFVVPEDFVKLKEYALNLGFLYVESAPFARSCYYNGIPNFFNNISRMRQ